MFSWTIFYNGCCYAGDSRDAVTTVAENIDIALNNGYKLNPNKQITGVQRGAELVVPVDVKLKRIQVIELNTKEIE